MAQITQQDLNAINFVRSFDKHLYNDIVIPIQAGLSHAVTVLPDGVLTKVFNHGESVWMWMSFSRKTLLEFASYVLEHSSKGDDIMIHGTRYLDEIINMLKPHYTTELLYLAQRENPEPFKPVTDAEILPLTHEYDKLVAETYGVFKKLPNRMELAYLSIEDGMLGAFKDGQCIGFVGTHPECTIGLLEVLPQYRRMGYGKALSESMANIFIQKGITPSCHVMQTNTASLLFHKEMDFSIYGPDVVFLDTSVKDNT